MKFTGWGALVVCAGASACSAPPALVTAFVATSVNCSGGGMTITQIGEVTSATLPETSPDGTIIGGHAINLICTVSGNGQYSLNLYASDSNGVTTINGQATSSGSTSLTGTFIYGTTGTVYDGSNCTLTFKFEGSSLPAGATGIAPGLVWGHVSCMTAMAEGQAQGSAGATCDVESDVLFENCSE